MHRAYLAAGSDIIETNSFSGTKSDLADYGRGRRILRPDARARRGWREPAADEFSTTAKPRFVAGAMGPTT